MPRVRLPKNAESRRATAKSNGVILMSVFLGPDESPGAAKLRIRVRVNIRGLPLSLGSTKPS
jgi:hypothetical protein